MKNSVSAPLYENDIKAGLLNHLRNLKLLSKDATIINEFTVSNYERRVDIAIFQKNTSTAYEVKSDYDTLHRLDGQLNTYLEYFDKVVVVTTRKHIAKVLKQCPMGVAVWEINNNKIIIKQRGKKLIKKQNKKLLEMLTARELSKLCTMLNIPKEDYTRAHFEHLLMDAPLSTLKNAALHFISIRYEKSSSHFWNKVKNKIIEPNDIDYLSPYKQERAIIMKNERKSQKFWAGLASNLGLSAEDPYLAALYNSEGPEIFGPVPTDITKLLNA